MPKCTICNREAAQTYQLFERIPEPDGTLLLQVKERHEPMCSHCAYGTLIALYGIFTALFLILGLWCAWGAFTLPDDSFISMMIFGAIMAVAFLICLAKLLSALSARRRDVRLPDDSGARAIILRGFKQPNTGITGWKYWTLADYHVVKNLYEHNQQPPM